MAKANKELIDALRKAANRLEDPTTKYEWGHMGRCNCGHLVQTVTEMTDVEIVKSIDDQLDEWTEHARDYCPNTGHKVEDLFETMRNMGFDPQDMMHLEYLSDEEVLNFMGDAKRHLRKNITTDVSLYMKTMANMLEQELLGST